MTTYHGESTDGAADYNKPTHSEGGQSSMDKTAKERKKTQQYMDRDMREYTSSKDQR